MGFALFSILTVLSNMGPPRDTPIGWASQSLANTPDLGLIEETVDKEDRGKEGNGGAVPQPAPPVKTRPASLVSMKT